MNRRHIYCCPVTDEAKHRFQWCLLQSTQPTEPDETGTRPAPMFKQLTAGHPSLARLLADALGLFLQAAGRVDLTITDRAAATVQTAWLPETPIAVETILGDKPTTIMLPENPTLSLHRWTYITRANGRLAWSSTTRFSPRSRASVALPAPGPRPKRAPRSGSPTRRPPPCLR
jgi:hypothetical protein